MNVFLDIETIPDQSDGAIDRIAEYLTVRAPDLTKPKFIEALGLGDDGKYKTVPELKEMWLLEFEHDAKIEQAKEKWLKTSFDGAYGQIICIGYAFAKHDVKVLSVQNMTEAEILTEFWHDVNEGTMSRPRKFIAHNTSFDLPFIWHRSVINGVNPGVKFDPWARQGERRYCTMEAWAGFKGTISLDNLAKILGVQGKSAGMTGADVWPEFEKGNIDKISEYCADDVEVLRNIYNRMNFL